MEAAILCLLLAILYTVLYPGFQKWGSFGPLLSEFGGQVKFWGVQLINIPSHQI